MEKEKTERRQDQGIEDFTSLIETHAWVTLSKVKKPTFYTFEDLFQEGAIAFLFARKYYKSNKSASFKTFLIRVLQGHLCSIVRRSYKTPNYIDTITEFLPNMGRDYIDLRKVLFDHQEEFNKEEFHYITYLLSPPRRITKEMGNHIARRRQVIRRELHISLHKESCIRTSIKKKLEVCCI